MIELFGTTDLNVAEAKLQEMAAEIEKLEKELKEIN